MFFFFFFNDTATTEIYTLSLHDALPICDRQMRADDRVRTHHAVFGGGEVHGAALAAHQAVVALHQFAEHLLHRYAARERVRVATIGAEAQIPFFHGAAEARRDRLLADGEAAGA